MNSSLIQVLARDRRAPEVVSFSEQDLTLEFQTERDCGMSHIAAELIGAPTYRDREQIIRGILGIIGFSTLGYATLRASKGRPIRACVLKNYVPGHSQTGYFRERHYEIDPRAPLAHPYGVPIVWNLNDLFARASNRHDDRRVGRFLHGMEADRMHSGIMFGIFNPHYSLYSLISLTSTDARQGWICNTALGQSMALGLAVHRVASGYARSLAAQARMSNPVGTQRRILSCLVEGMPNREIASRLNMTSHRVDDYLGTLQERYLASNRTQLAFIAGRMLSV